MEPTSNDNGRSGKGLVFVISSVSGGGKTTVIKGLMEALPGIRMSVSHTTRKRRSGELEGGDYHFVSGNSFKRMIDEGLFLEWAEVYGHHYGTSVNEVNSITNKGFDAVLDIDVQGAMQVKEKRGDAILIFIVPPGEQEQARRLRERGTESEREVEVRLEAARRELAFENEYHYSVLNAELNQAVDTVRCIVVAERCRRKSKKESEEE